MVAPIKSQAAGQRELALPIHPCITLADWVGAAHFVLIDGEMGPEQQVRILREIERDPAAFALYRQTCEDELMLSELFTQARDADALPAEPAQVA